VSTIPNESDVFRCAVAAVDIAVRALCADPASPAVGSAVRSARSAVAQLSAGLVVTTMSRLLDTVEQCRRSGLRSSTRLTAQRGAAARAVRLAMHNRAA
jgi:hypothetical protein